MKRRTFPRRAGSALILVLWSLLVIAMAVMGIIELVNLSVAHASQRAAHLQARALAESGIAYGLEPQLERNDPLLKQTLPDGQKLQVLIGSEGARLNINAILQAGHREILAALFNSWGLDPGQASSRAACLYDWVTPGDLPSLGGAKAEAYERAGLAQRPTGEPFRSLDEVRLVLGMDAVEKVRPNWEESFTIWSSGPLDVNEAPADLIAAVLGIDVARVNTFVKQRNGRDGLVGTPDDQKVTDIATFEAQLGVPALVAASVSTLLSLDDPVRRVESTGQAGKQNVTISAITRLNSFPLIYLLWHEQ